MSRSEDYLDNLLNTATSAGRGQQPTPGSADFEQKFLDDFENQLLEDEDDSFLLDFEKELDGMGGMSSSGASAENVSDNQSFLDDLNGIVNGAKQQMEESGGEAAPMPQKETMEEQDDGSDFVVDTLTESLDADTLGMMEETEKPKESPKTESSGDNVDMMSLFGEDEDFSELGEMLHAGDNGLDALKEMAEEEQEETGKKGKKAKKKKGKKEKTKESKEKNGEKESFLQKFSRILFGEDEEEELQGAQAGKIPIVSDSNEIEELSDENMEILAALGGGGEASAPAEPQETEEEKKARLKKEKKEEKEKKAKEKKEAKAQKKKEAKEKKAKEKKEKPPKPPKEKDNTPPLPKKPVILMFVMAVSILVLVIMGSNLVNYSSSISITQQAFDSGDYTGAYAEIGGIEVKEADEPLYQKTLILASLQSQYEAYEIFAQYNEYDLALDALISVIGRYDLNYEDAEEYGCTVELGLIEQDAEKALMEQFGVTAEQARELYGIRDREDYSLEVYRIIYSLGLQKVAEE